MALTISMDPAGRIVIPKSIRDQHGFGAGTEFELTLKGNRIYLRPVERPAVLEELPNGWLVFESSLPPEFDIVGDIARGRAERDERVAGKSAP
jgi:AbrB family looped-hinge helix DNA binding protein